MLKVLLVDDENIILKCMVETIDWESVGFEVVAQASDGKTALELYKQHHPDIIITDIYMPQMTGLELAREVRKLSSETELIILTAYSDFEYAKQAIDYGIASYQLKPIKNSDLINTLLNLKSKIETRRFDKSATDLSASKTDFDIQSLLFSDAQIKTVINAVKKRDMVTIQKITDNYFAKFKSCGAPIKPLIDDVSGLTAIIRKEVVQSTTLMDSMFNRRFKPFGEISHITDISDVEAWLKDFFKTIIDSAAFYTYLKARPIVQRAIIYIMEHYSEKISTQTVSDLLMISPEHLTRLFKADIGKTFMTYLVEYRIKIAVDLLKNTNYKIYEISNMVGYSNVMYFNKIFKSATGNTPSHYQNPRKD